MQCTPENIVESTQQSSSSCSNDDGGYFAGSFVGLAGGLAASVVLQSMRPAVVVFSSPHVLVPEKQDTAMSR